MKTAFSVATRIRATPERVFWFLADPSTASVIDPAVRSYEPEGGTLYTWSMDFVPTGVGGRLVAGFSAALLGRNAIAQGELVRKVLEAATGPVPPQT